MQVQQKQRKEELLPARGETDWRRRARTQMKHQIMDSYSIKVRGDHMSGREDICCYWKVSSNKSLKSSHSRTNID